MNIELRNVIYAAFASQETACFTADVWVDGVKAGHARNDGQGGCTIVHPGTLSNKLHDYGATLPEQPIGGLNDQATGTPYMRKQDAESLIDDAFETWLATRDLKRLLAKRLLYIKAGDTKNVYKTPTLNKGVLARKCIEMRALIDAGQPLPNADKCLNVLPFDEALKLYREAT